MFKKMFIISAENCVFFCLLHAGRRVSEARRNSDRHARIAFNDVERQSAGIFLRFGMNLNGIKSRALGAMTQSKRRDLSRGGLL
jgi:hypothetical protein